MKTPEELKKDADTLVGISDLKYRVELTRVHKKRVAPAGKIFLVAHVKDGKDSYSESVAVLLATPEKELNEMAQTMINQIKKQYSL